MNFSCIYHRIIETKLWNRIEYEFFVNNIIIYIKKEIAENFNFDWTVNKFKNLKKRITILYMCDFFIILILIYEFIYFCISDNNSIYKFWVYYFDCPKIIGEEDWCTFS